jgi:hypothetical protein
VEAAKRGEEIVNGKAKCSGCHVPLLYTEPDLNTHTADEFGIDNFQASRSSDQSYHTAPLPGLWTHQKVVSTAMVALPHSRMSSTIMMTTSS